MSAQPSGRSVDYVECALQAMAPSMGYQLYLHDASASLDAAKYGVVAFRCTTSEVDMMRMHHENDTGVGLSARRVAGSLGTSQPNGRTAEPTEEESA